MAVEYSAVEQVLVIDTDDGPRRRVLLLTGELAEALDGRQRRVHVELDESRKFARQIRVLL